MSDQITVVGTIATSPATIGAGTPTQLCTFRLASNDRRYDRDKNEWLDGPTNWYSINVYRSLGEHAEASLNKGDRILVQGRLKVRKWEKNEKSGTSVSIDADALGHDLRWGTTVFTKLTRSAGDPGTQGQPHEPGQQARWQTPQDQGTQVLSSPTGGGQEPAAGLHPAESQVSDPAGADDPNPETSELAPADAGEPDTAPF